MTRIDVNTFIGGYPYRDIGAWDAHALLAEMDYCATEVAWVSHLAAMFWRDPTAGNAALFELARREPRLVPVAAVHPGLPHWEEVLDEARRQRCPAVRCDPTWYGLPPSGGEMRALARACGRVGLPLMLAVRLEDGRQRHPTDGSAELAPWAIRDLIRADNEVRLIVTHADREFIEQAHFGATIAESERILWDIAWIWGPPEDHLELLLRTVGPRRFAFGTGMPLRLAENALAKLDLLDLSAEELMAIRGGNVREFVGGG